MRVYNNSFLALPRQKGSENGSKLQQHVGNSTVQVFREWGHATIVCWHYNGTGVQRMGNATIVCWHYNGTGVQRMGHATIVCWHYNGTGVQRMGHATIVCWHYNGTGVQKIAVGNQNLLALQWHKGSENRGRQLQFVGTTILQGQTITVCCCLMKQQ